MTPPVAKAKKRLHDEEADREAVEIFDKSLPVIARKEEAKPQNEVTTLEVVNIMADEIQVLYGLNGSEIDEVNARDKALILWRELKVNGVHARDRAVPHTLCEDHG